MEQDSGWIQRVRVADTRPKTSEPELPVNNIVSGDLLLEELCNYIYELDNEGDYLHQTDINLDQIAGRINNYLNNR